MSRVAKEKPGKLVFILNKADRNPFYEDAFRVAWDEALADVAADCPDESGAVVEPVWVKAISTTEGGANRVLDTLFEFAEEGEKLFPEDIVTDYPRKLAMSDVIREKFLARLHQEIPHELGIAVKKIVESDGRWDVEADVIVNRNSQKPIVIGRGAETLKNVRKRSERELSEIFGVKVALKLWVRVEPKWMQNEKILSEMGYVGGEI